MNNSNISKGVITYMHLENFVTYNSVCIKPGKNLNVIIGPNGTGKSTIVCAIVLGLGGKLSTIGRATQISSYVKAGYEQAKIEIHLSNGRKNDIVICRIFNTQGKSTWYLDQRPSNTKEIQDLTKSLNIQVDNLCQFLPQDKVQDFSKMNAQELLENTERSVGDPIILEHHMTLIKLRAEYKNIVSQIENKKRVLNTKSQLYEGLKESVSCIKERKSIKKRIVPLKQKKAWMLYDQKRRELLKLTKKRTTIKGTVTSLELELKPINDLIEKIRSEIKVLQSSVIDYKSKLNIKTSKVKNMMNDILRCENQIKEHENECKQAIQTEEARDHDIDEAKQQKSKLDGDLILLVKDTGSEETLMKQQQEIVTIIDRQRSIIAKLTSEHSALQQQEERLNLDIRTKEEELQLLNIESKRLRLLRERSLDTYKAVHWLRENRNKFSGVIHEPILLNINVKDASNAKYLETIIANRDLIAFVCENKKDMNLLLHYLRDEQNLQINVVHSDPAKQVSMNPIIPLHSIKQYGFTDYLASLIETPSTIMKYLIIQYNLNSIPIGTNLVDDKVDDIPSQIRCFFSRSNVYAVNKSKYTGEKSITIQPVSGSGILSIVLDKSKLAHIEETLKTLREQKTYMFNKIKQLEDSMNKQNVELDKYRANRNKKQQDYQKVQALKSRISMAEQKLERLQNERTSIDKIKEAFSNKIKAILDKQLNIYRTYNNELEDCFKYIISKEQTELAMKLQNRLLRVKINDSQDLIEKLKVIKDKMRDIDTEIIPMKNEVKKMYDEAIETTDGVNPNDEAFAPINKAFSKLPPTIEEINNELNILQARMFCMKKNINAENILREYEEIEKDIGNIKNFIEEKTQELGMMEQKVNVLRKEWQEPLLKVIEKINSNFSSHFSTMNCAGEVTLAQPDNDMDFDQYGLKIKVKFRNTDPLHELTRHHQSGGERAVTTAIYMIALQELTRVPFRCVDEINQGMDAVNERRVFNLLVQITGRQNSSQYFLLTPKLLPNLVYSETVTVHCVFNGLYMINHTEFDTEEYCQHIVRALGRN